jgi:hypothetical protein
MQMPGFTAEVSVYKTSTHYYGTASAFAPTTQVTPQRTICDCPPWWLCIFVPFPFCAICHCYPGV